jgi:hypothetical protein
MAEHFDVAVGGGAAGDAAAMGAAVTAAPLCADIMHDLTIRIGLLPGVTA